MSRLEGACLTRTGRPPDAPPAVRGAADTLADLALPSPVWGPFAVLAFDLTSVRRCLPCTTVPSRSVAVVTARWTRTGSGCGPSVTARTAGPRAVMTAGEARAPGHPPASGARSAHAAAQTVQHLPLHKNKQSLRDPQCGGRSMVTCFSTVTIARFFSSSDTCQSTTFPINQSS
jgi:hypothetical protein